MKNSTFETESLHSRPKLDIADFRVILGVKTCEVFHCFLAIIFLGSIVLTSHWLAYLY